MAKYQQLWDPIVNAISETVLRTSDNAYIPNDPANRDRVEFEAWLDEGNQPNPPKGDPTPPIETLPPPDIVEVNAQVQDIDARLTALEDQVGR